MSSSTNLMGLARQVVDAGLLDENKALEALQQAKRNQTPLVTWLVQNKLIKSRALMELVADQFGIAYFDLNAIDPNVFPKDLINERLARQYRVLPLFKRFIALSDLGNQHAINDIRFSSGMSVEPLLVEDDKLGHAIDRLYQSDVSGLEGMDDSELDSLNLESTESSGPEQADEADETPVVRFVNKMLLDAIKGGSSDLHFEPYEKMYRVRFRTDGVLYEVSRPPIQLRDRISARLKVMACMDISERRKPQDGRIKLNVSVSKSIDFRVSTLPTLWGRENRDAYSRLR